MTPVRLLLVSLSLLLAAAVSATPLDPHPPVFQLHPSSRQISRQYTRDELVGIINSQHLPVSERHALLKAASKVLSEFNPNTFLHINFLKQNARVRLSDLSKEVHSLSNLNFHLKVIRIFADLDDLHTVYSPPEPLRSAVAVTLEDVSTYYEFPGAKRPKYFFPDTVIRLVAVNGRDIHTVARELGSAAYAANYAAKLEYGRAALTTRSLSRDFWPEKENESYTFVLNNDTSNHISRSFAWSYFALTPEASERVNNGESAFVSSSSSSSGSAEVSRAELLVAPVEVRPRHIIPVSRRLRTPPPRPPQRQSSPATTFASIFASSDKRVPVAVHPSVSEFLQVQIVQTKSGHVGHIRLTTFFPPDFRQVSIAVIEIGRVLSSVLPHNSVIFDIRDNPGGYLRFAKFVFELLHVNENVPPLPLFSRATTTTKSMYSEFNLSATGQGEADLYSAAVNESFNYGEQFTGPVAALYSLAGAFEGLVDLPRVPAQYNGTFVMLTSARSFSASDMLSAWTRDATQGIVVGVDGSTGGGGATVLNYERDLRSEFPQTYGERLNKGIDFTTAATRFFRSGMKGGTLIELFGVTPEVRYYPTRRDREEDDEDMFVFLAELLKTRASGSS